MKKILYAGLVIAGICLFMLVVWFFLVLSDLPDPSVLRHYRPAAAAEILDKDGRILTQYFDRAFRIWVPISTLPDTVIQAVTTAEDDTFFEHRGVNYKATWEALIHDVQKRRFARGGSTITQQMIKNVFLSGEKTFSRKLREYVLARKAEELLTKRRILEIYLNEVEWGDNIYGIEAASRFYFDKHASELTAPEAALLAGILPNPHSFNPYKRPDKAKDRREHVLANMLQAKLITMEEYSAGMGTAIHLRSEHSSRFPVPFLEENNAGPCHHYALEQVLLRLYGENNIYRGGWVISTSLDKKLLDELNALEEEAWAPRNLPERIIVITQDELIRGVVCSLEKEGEVRDKYGPGWFFPGDYDVSAVPFDSIMSSQIVLSIEKENQPHSGK